MPEHYSEKPTDTILRIRTHQALIDRLWKVARANRRTNGKEALIAIEKHLDAEEARLGISTAPPNVAILETKADVIEHFQKPTARAAEEPAPAKKRRRHF